MRGDKAKSVDAGTPPVDVTDLVEVSPLSARVRLAARAGAGTSDRARVMGAVGLVLMLGLVAAALIVPLAAQPQSPRPSLVGAAGQGEQNAIATEIVSPTLGPSQDAAATQVPSASGAPIVVSTDRVPDTGGSDWYKGWNSTYTQVLRGGETVSAVVSDHGQGTCQGFLEYSHGDVRGTYGTVDGSDTDDPWHAEFTT